MNIQSKGRSGGSQVKNDIKLLMTGGLAFAEHLERIDSPAGLLAFKKNRDRILRDIADFRLHIHDMKQRYLGGDDGESTSELPSSGE